MNWKKSTHYKPCPSINQKQFWKNYDYSFVRSGGGLFGIDPNKKNRDLKNVISLKAKILQIRDLENEPVKSIGYNSTYNVRSSLRIAVLGIGYADGYPRNLSNNGYAIFKGKKLPIVGNISMDYMTVDISCIKDKEINLGPTEFKLLDFFIKNPKRVIKIRYTVTQW